MTVATALQLERFDRHALDPLNNPTHERWLNSLRHPGRFRGLREAESTAFLWGLDRGGSVLMKKGYVFIDLGCGDSGDYIWPDRQGMTVHRFDLVEPWFHLSGDYEQQYPHRVAERRRHFTKADVVEQIPLPDNSVDFAVSQAMYDLIEPEGRERFFDEVNRVLKPGGIFTCYAIPLKSGGWGLDMENDVHMNAMNHWYADELWLKSQGFSVVKNARKAE